jgi:hypothetical protein
MDNLIEKYCSESCKDNINRSFMECPECGKMWAPNDKDSEKYYCNTSWLMCKQCSEINNCCVVCGKKL